MERTQAEMSQAKGNIQSTDSKTDSDESAASVLRDAIRSICFILCGQYEPEEAELPDDVNALRHNAMNALRTAWGALSAFPKDVKLEKTGMDQAQEIRELRGQLEAVIEALKPFDRVELCDGVWDGNYVNLMVKAIDIHNVRAALAKIGGKP